MSPVAEMVAKVAAMTPAERATAVERIWRNDPFKHVLRSGENAGQRAIVRPRGVGHFHIPLTHLTNEDIALALPCGALDAVPMPRRAAA